jgi:hypothetical protein
MIWAAAALAGGLALPHLWPRRWLAPVTGIALWLSVLALRATITAVALIVLVLYIPATQLFQLITHWCFHAVIPFITVHLGFSGHTLGDAALLVPALAITVSATYALYASWRAARLVRTWLRSSSLGVGPKRSVLVGGPEVVVAAAGLVRPQVVVSTGALTQLDDDELAAGLEHELGHIRRKHRFWALAGRLLHSIARLLPGSKRAFEELHFHLERDADEYAVRRTGDPLALAQAICKAALGDRRHAAAAFSLAGHVGRARLGALMERHNQPGRIARIGGIALAVLPAAIALALLFSAPTIASVGLEQATGSVGPHC